MPGSMMASPSPKNEHQFGITAALSLSGPSDIDLTRNQDLEKVHCPGGDIDALCIGPCYATREEDFFIVLHSMLLATPEVTELHAIPDAHVPVLKFKFDGISIDLLYARLAMWVIPENLDISQDSILCSMDEPSVRSLNGCRVADQILQLVPDVEVTGFLGGISWALLVARVCQLYPNAVPGMLVSRFFRVYTQWRWPNPVMLCKIEEGPLHLAVWDARKNLKDRTHVMPIITPSYPCMNSSYNVSLSTLNVLKEQFDFGNGACQAVESRHAEWSHLFQDYPFFSAYKNYLQIDVVAFCEEDLRTWKGWVESRLRQLTLKIERDTFGIVQCHLHPSSYVDSTKSVHHTAFFMGLSCSQEGKEFDLREPVEEFKHFVSSAFHQKPGMEICISHVRRKQIPVFVFQEGDPSSRPPRSGTKASKSSKSKECRTGEEGSLLSGQMYEVSQVSVFTLRKRQKVATSSKEGVPSGHVVSPVNTDYFEANEIKKNSEREATRDENRLLASNHPLIDEIRGSKMQERESRSVLTASKKHNMNLSSGRWLEREPRSKALGLVLPVMDQAMFGTPFGQATNGQSSCGNEVSVIGVNGHCLETGSHSHDVQAALNSKAALQRAKMAVEI